ncbi:acylphosphatase [Sellimonas caecigallum]|uniref:acylphosphatase n=1 Tax=Sellimonas caecigallum TaxID=2592333 RepID=A0ABS7L9D0_9FIRM|nr:acylphosphatase [Sellimonas caecigallum]MBY0759698.1 acylphosphatase [Sellimonas caecigallum]OUO99902.1 acylphosphatase [Drancourtella sp. An210]OUP66494.1 acylphosphatase [Drancourtella sp. An177]
MEVRRHVYFYGRVQGVGFRWKAMQTAKYLNLTGWVQNMYNGNVEMEVQGEKALIDRLFHELNSDRFIRIEKTEVLTLPLVDGERDFKVRG